VILTAEASENGVSVCQLQYSCISISDGEGVLRCDGKRLTVLQYTARIGGVFRSISFAVEGIGECVDRMFFRERWRFGSGQSPVVGRLRRRERRRVVGYQE
jgi:hypothetical protein